VVEAAVQCTVVINTREDEERMNSADVVEVDERKREEKGW
jgi:hypothetical protein